MAAVGEDLTVSATTEHGFVLLTVDYGPGLLAQSNATHRLSERFTQEYAAAAAPLVQGERWPSCMIDIKARIAGTPLVRAMFDLHRFVYERGGRLVCIGYPREYLNSLTSVAITSLPGFELASGKEDAYRRFSAPA